MADKQAFSFGDDSVASGYNNVLVPMLFDPWARRLIEEHRPWSGRRILDLATGTGIVAQHLAAEVGSDGHVLAVDINPEMLALARERCAGLPVQFVQSSVDPLRVEDDSVDDLPTSFEGAGFKDVRLERQEQPMKIPGGRAQGVEAAFATPIGPRLRSLPAERQQQFRSALAAQLDAFGAEDSLGRMVSSVLVASA